MCVFNSFPCKGSVAHHSLESGAYFKYQCAYPLSIRLIGFDGKKIKRKIEHRDGQKYFEALLGVGVTVNDYAKFVDAYSLLIDRIFKENGLKRNKALYKGSDLVSIFYGKGIDLLPLIVNNLLELVDFVDIYFHYIPEYFDKDKTVPTKIGVYHEEELKYFTNMEFIDLIQNHFPALCCYSYLHSMGTDVQDVPYCIDDCPGILPSHATVSIIKHDKTRFLFRGDQVNYAVNAADIFCRFIEETTRADRIHIDKNMITLLGLPANKVAFHFISPNWLNVIKPARSTPLNISHKYPHPIYFLQYAKSSSGL